MCGIAGIIAKSNCISKSTIQSDLLIMQRALNHRGPDSYGIALGENYGLLNVRLAIVDIEHGNQPMYYGDSELVYNGEIYNHKILRKEHFPSTTFTSDCDTEVLLKFVHKYKFSKLEQLNGMFAFCYHDQTTDDFILARDRFGIKPLYIYEDNNSIIFASELKAILSIKGVNKTLNPDGILDFLHYRYTPSTNTIYKYITKLDPGCFLIIHNRRGVKLPFYNNSYSESSQTLNELKEEFSSILQEVVQSQLMGDVPVGTLLSGGLDSSVISEAIHSNGNNLTCFNIGFENLNEFEYSKLLADKLSFKYVQKTISSKDILERFEEIGMAMDEPLADPACFPLYLLGEELKNHVKVVLSGEGSDEIFGGYPQYTKNIKHGSSYDEFLKDSWYFTNSKKYINTPHLQTFTTHRFKKYFLEYSRLSGMLNFDMHTWVPDNLMMKADKVLMQHSIEGRFPFLDNRIVDFANKLPEKYKITDSLITKWFLKEYAIPKLPHEILFRDKMGFSVPVDELLHKLKPTVYDCFSTLAIVELTNIIDVQEMKKTVDYFYKGQSNLALEVWTIFILLYWLGCNYV